jgi:hypothetical protein
MSDDESYSEEDYSADSYSSEEDDELCYGNNNNYSQQQQQYYSSPTSAGYASTSRDNGKTRFRRGFLTYHYDMTLEASILAAQPDKGAAFRLKFLNGIEKVVPSSPDLMSGDVKEMVIDGDVELTMHNDLGIPLEAVTSLPDRNGSTVSSSGLTRKSSKTNGFISFMTHPGTTTVVSQHLTERGADLLQKYPIEGLTNFGNHMNTLADGDVHLQVGFNTLLASAYNAIPEAKKSIDVRRADEKGFVYVNPKHALAAESEATKTVKTDLCFVPLGDPKSLVIEFAAPSRSRRGVDGSRVISRPTLASVITNQAAANGKKAREMDLSGTLKVPVAVPWSISKA